jgi:hypothetical protein
MLGIGSVFVRLNPPPPRGDRTRKSIYDDAPLLLVLPSLPGNTSIVVTGQIPQGGPVFSMPLAETDG